MLAVLQIEDRKDEFILALMRENKRVCDENNELYVHMARGNDHVPPYWSKVFELLKFMQENSDVDLVMWLDSDAFFTSYDTMNPHELVLLHPNYTMWTSPDAPPKYSSDFCAGSFLVRNDVRGRQLMSDWKQMYDPGQWRYDDADDRWITEAEFAGNAYEQGTFTENMLNRSDVCRLPYYVFNEIDCDHPHYESVSIHLAGEYKKEYRQQCEKRLTIESFVEYQSICKYAAVITTIVCIILLILNRT